MFPRFRGLGILCLMTSASVALAQDSNNNGYDADIDLIRPMFAPTVLPGFDVPANNRGGTVRWGIAAQYTLSPLVLYEFDEEVGAVVGNRTSAYLGVSVDITRSLTARISMPAHLQWGSQVPRYASDGFAFGDLDIGGHWAFFRKPTFSMGLRADLRLPTSRRDFYAGEANTRFYPGLMLMADAGRFRWVGDIGVNIRTNTVRTTEDWNLSHELAFNNGFRVSVLPEQLAVGLSIYSRFGFANFFGAGESTAEAMANVAYGPVILPGNIQLETNLGLGRGFTLGYGSSDFRAMLQLSFQKIRPPRPGEEGYGEVEEEEDPKGDEGVQFNVRDIGQVVDPNAAVQQLTDEPKWEEGELARVDRETERIRIRFAIRFKVGTDELLPESIPTLEYIADLLNNDARIAHVVVEGHASSDGEYAPNFRLSVSRAGAIWSQMLKSGVHPSRVSIRGMGEVVPAEATGGYDELQASRRVVFHIVDQIEEWESPPEYPLDLRYPWDGQPYKATQPRMPLPGEELEVPGLEPRVQEDQLDDVDFSEQEDEEEDEAFEMDAPSEDDEETETEESP